MPWTDELDNEVRAYAANKGWDRLDPQKAAISILGSYRELERTRPAPVAPPPPSAYTFDGVKNADGSVPDPDFLGFVRQVASEQKLSVDAANTLAAQFIKWGDDAEATERAAQTARFTEGETKLKAAWAADYDKNLDLSGKAFNALGLPKETIDALVQQVGVDTLMEQGLKLGRQMGEATFLTGESNVGDKVQVKRTAAEALVERNRLMGDAAFGKKFADGDPEAFKTIETLSREIVGTPENWREHPKDFGRTKEDVTGENYNWAAPATKPAA